MDLMGMDHGWFNLRASHSPIFGYGCGLQSKLPKLAAPSLCLLGCWNALHCFVAGWSASTTRPYELYDSYARTSAARYAGAAVNCILRTDDAATQVYSSSSRQTDHSFAEKQTGPNHCSSGSSDLAEYRWTMGLVHNRLVHGHAS